MTGLGDCFRGSLGEGRRVNNDSQVFGWSIGVQMMPFTKIGHTGGNNWFRAKYDNSNLFFRLSVRFMGKSNRRYSVGNFMLGSRVQKKKNFE